MAQLFRGPAIRVSQPIGEFWIASIPAGALLRSTAPDPLRVSVDPSMARTATEWEKAGKLSGNQRPIDKRRLQEIATYIETFESTFPNSIILAAPSVAESDDITESPWRIEGKEGGDTGTLVIPNNPLLASVVDGQHRLYAYTQLTSEELLSMQLVCSVFMDLPLQMQAMVFATINTTQKQVRRGLAMNMLGYNVEDEKRDIWSPQKLAVFMARRLNFDDASPLYHRVKVEALNAPPAAPFTGAKRPIGMAAVVDGVMGLITRNAEEDRSILRRSSTFSSTRRRDLVDDGAVLRTWYKNNLDAELYQLLLQTFTGIRDVMWDERAPKLLRAVDVRGLLDFSADLIKSMGFGDQPAAQGLKAFPDAWRSALSRGRPVDFSDSFFEASYRGRRRVQNAFRLVNGLLKLSETPDADRSEYERLLPTPGRSRS